MDLTVSSRLSPLASPPLSGLISATSPHLLHFISRSPSPPLPSLPSWPPFASSNPSLHFTSPHTHHTSFHFTPASPLVLLASPLQLTSALHTHLSRLPSHSTHLTTSRSFSPLPSLYLTLAWFPSPQASPTLALLSLRLPAGANPQGPPFRTRPPGGAVFLLCSPRPAGHARLRWLSRRPQEPAGPWGQRAWRCRPASPSLRAATLCSRDSRPGRLICRRNIMVPRCFVPPCCSGPWLWSHRRVSASGLSTDRTPHGLLSAEDPNGAR